jgi:putative ABC transport system permease protein
MVMNVANKSIIRKITMRFLKAGKARNIIAVIAITLTSLMFTSVFTLGGSMLSAIQEDTMRQVGTRAHGGLKYLTPEQYAHFMQSPLIKDISYLKVFGFAENEALKKISNEIYYSEDNAARWRYSYPTSGEMPREKNAVACSTIVLNALGIPNEIGAAVPLEYTVGSVTYSDTFVLSGFWEGDAAMPAEFIWLAKDFVDEMLNGAIITDNFIGTINAEVWFNNSFNIAGKMEALIAERGYALDEISLGINWAYMASELSFDPAAFAIVVLVLALILFSGYLIIYSIFLISVNADIHFYGLLKTIGMTGKQIRKIIRRQALILSAMGIPIGLLLGYFTGIGLSPFILKSFFDIGGIYANINPVIFLFAAAFSMLTVFIGCRKPGKIAARVSPVEAVKYSGTFFNIKTQTKKGGLSAFYAYD